MSFGKKPPTRPSEPQAAPQPAIAVDPHGRKRVFPTEVWEGKTGAMLRELGFDPNDENNFVPNRASQDARLAEGRAALEARSARANAEAVKRFPRAVLRPFSLLPDPCWNGDTGAFLMLQLDLYPYDEWNIAFLPADMDTAHAVDAAPHPGKDIPQFVKLAAEFMAREDAALKALVRETERTQNFAGFHDAREAMRARVKALAAFFLAEMDKAWKTHTRGPAR